MMFSIDFLTEFSELQPMIAGIWCGKDKPPLNEYLNPLIHEIEDILLSGIQIKDFHIKIRFGNCYCDTPARSYIKGKF